MVLEPGDTVTTKFGDRGVVEKDLRLQDQMDDMVLVRFEDEHGESVSSVFDVDKLEKVG